MEPESWLALGVLLMLIFANLATPSVECWKTGAVFVLSRGACDAITTYSINVIIRIVLTRCSRGLRLGDSETRKWQVDKEAEVRRDRDEWRDSDGETVKAMTMAFDRCVVSRRRLRFQKSEGASRWWSSKGMKLMDGATAVVAVGQDSGVREQWLVATRGPS